MNWPRSILTSLSESGRVALSLDPSGPGPGVAGVSLSLTEINEGQKEEIVMGAENEDDERKSTYADHS